MHNMATAAKAQSKPSSRDLSAAGLRTFFNIARDWALSTDEQMVLLGAPGRSTFFKWKSAPESADLKRDTLERLSYLLGIYKALQILLPSTSAADAWVKKPNTPTWWRCASTSTPVAAAGLEPYAVRPELVEGLVQCLPIRPRA